MNWSELYQEQQPDDQHDQAGAFHDLVSTQHTRWLLDEKEPLDEELVTSNDSEIIRNTLRIYGSMYLLCMLLFSFLRRRFATSSRSPFNIRSWSSKHKSTIARREYKGWFSWSWEVFNFTDDEIMDECGLDAICFLRALRFGRRLCYLGCFNAVWLVPTFYSAKDSNETYYLEDPLVLISVSNLPSSSKRFLAPVLAAYMIFFWTMFLLLEEFDWFTKARHRFLSKPEIRNYAVYVSGIPEAFRSSKALGNYFRQCSSRDAVLQAHIAYDIPNLDAKVARRKALIQKLEHAAAVEKLSGKKETHRRIDFQRGIETVESIAAFKEELADLNRTISRQIHDIVGSDESRLRSQLIRHVARRSVYNANEEEGEERSADAEMSGFLDEESGSSEPVSSCSRVTGKGSDQSLSNLEPEAMSDSLLCQPQSNLALAALTQQDFGKASPEEKVSDEELTAEGASTSESRDVVPVEMSMQSVSLMRDDSAKYSNKSELIGSRNSSRRSVGSSGKTAQQIKESIRRSVMSGTKALSVGTAVAGAQAEKLIQSAGDMYVETLKAAGSQLAFSAGAVVPMLLTKSEGSPRDAGFVIFTDLYTTQTALQMIHHGEPYMMNVIPAGEPSSCFWRNVGMPHRAQRSGRIAAIAASAVLCLFWSIPTSFFSSLTEVDSLKRALPKVGRWTEKYDYAEAVVAQVAPLLLLFFNEVILPSILKYFARWEGHVSSAFLESSLFVKLGWFMITQTFFVSAFSGTVTSELKNIIENPESVVTFLANALPQQSSYFCQIALTSTFFLQSAEMLRLYPLFLALLRRCFGPRLTSKEQSQTWGWLHVMDDPPDFWHAETFAQLILFYLVFFVYNSIAPVTAIFLLFCFILVESGYRYQFVHCYPRDKGLDTGGRLWRYFIHFTLASMVIAQITLIGFLALKQSTYAGPALGPLLALTVLFILYINSKHSHVSKFLPTRDCMLKDNENAVAGMMPQIFQKDAYLQPSLRQKVEMPDYSENGDEAGNDDGDHDK